jgi:hypothetical protein
MAMKATVIAPEYLRVRSSPTLSASVLGKHDRGTVIEVLGVVTAPDKAKWAIVPLTSGGQPLYIEGASPPAHAVGYMAASLLRFDAPAPIPSTPAQRLGLHILIPAADHGGEYAERAVAMGCRVMTVMDDELYALNLADRGVRVFFRWWCDWKLKPSDLAGRVASFCKHPNITILGLNEGDNYGCFTAEEMAVRGPWDAEAFDRIRNMGGKYAGGGWAVGNPEYNDPRVCEIVNRHYAPLWKAGMILNYHAYSPDFKTAFASADWYECRWRFLFTRCGLDPSNPGKSEIISDESGLDVMGSGGFSQFNVSAEQLRDWCAKHYRNQSMPLKVGGLTYPSPYTDATIFQASNSSRWAGYNVAHRLEGMQWQSS